MTLSERLAFAQSRPKNQRPDNDPDLCQLQAIWVRTYGNESGLAPVLKRFQRDPQAKLEDYVNRYIKQ